MGNWRTFKGRQKQGENEPLKGEDKERGHCGGKKKGDKNKTKQKWKRKRKK